MKMIDLISSVKLLADELTPTRDAARTVLKHLKKSYELSGGNTEISERQVAMVMVNLAKLAERKR